MILSTANLPTDLAKKSFSAMITRLMPNGSAPLFGLTSMLQTETALQFEHGFWTKTMLFPQLTLNGAIATGVITTFTVTSTSNVLPGMIFQASTTEENVLVVAVISSTQVQVSRGVGSVAAAAIADTVELYQVGNAFEESSVRPNANNIIPVHITNYTQIFRNTWAVSDSMRQTMMAAGDTNVAESKQDCAAFHAADIEKALFFGQKSSGTRNGQPFHTMAGLVAIVTDTTSYPSIYGGVANVFTLGATTTYTQLEATLDPVFNQATDPKVANVRTIFCGGAALKVLNNIGRLNGTYQLLDGQTSWGLQFRTFKTARGTFQLIEHPLFNTNTKWNKMAVAVDLSTYRIAYLGDRRTQNKEFNTNGDSAQDNGIDAVGGTLTTEMTCVIKNPPANSIIKNFTAAAAG